MREIKIYLEIFDLAEEVKVSKTGLEKSNWEKIGCTCFKLGLRILLMKIQVRLFLLKEMKLLLISDTIIDKEHIDRNFRSWSAKTILLHKEDAHMSDYAIIHNTLQKDPTNSEKEAVEHIYRQLRNAEPPDEETARGIIDKLFFSDQRYNLGEVGRYRMNKKLGLRY